MTLRWFNCCARTTVTNTLNVGSPKGISCNCLPGSLSSSYLHVLCVVVLLFVSRLIPFPRHTSTTRSYQTHVRSSEQFGPVNGMGQRRQLSSTQARLIKRAPPPAPTAAFASSSDHLRRNVTLTGSAMYKGLPPLSMGGAGGI